MITTNKKHTPQKEVGRFININILTIDNVSNILFFLTGVFVTTHVQSRYKTDDNNKQETFISSEGSR